MLCSFHLNNLSLDSAFKFVCITGFFQVSKLLCAYLVKTVRNSMNVLEGGLCTIARLVNSSHGVARVYNIIVIRKAKIVWKQGPYC